MSLHFYKIHPEHNLGGENYPHFRDYNDKKQYVLKKLINKDKKLNLHISKISYDSARLTVNLSKYLINRPANTISGLVTFFNTFDEQYWFVVGWSFGSNKNVVIYELQLDYWLTYWPLSFNKALVRVNRKHMNRFFSYTPTQTILNFISENRQLQIPEKTSPTAVYNSNICQIYYPKHLKIYKMVAIVVAPTAGFSEYHWDKTIKNNIYYPETGDNTPGKQNGFVIFTYVTNDNFTTWLSLPGITHCFYFTMDVNDINITDHIYTFEKGQSQFYAHEGKYFVQGKNTPDFKNKLQCVGTKENLFKLTYLNYKKIITLLSGLTYLTAQYWKYLDTTKINIIQVVNTTVNWAFYGDWFSSSQTDLEYRYQILSLKSLFPKNDVIVPTSKNNGTAIPRRYKNMFFTTINIFNSYMTHSIKRNKYIFSIKDDLDFWFKKENYKKDTKVSYWRKLKSWANFKFFLGFQNEIQEIYPYLGFRAYRYYWYITIQNSYFCAEPKHNDLLPFNKKYNLIAQNQSRFTNYTDNSLKFYQKQGFQFDTGINQSKYQLDWTKRYNQFAQNKFYYDATVGAMTSIFNRTSAVGGFGGKFGNVPMKAGIGIGAGIGAIEAGTNIYYGYQGMMLQNEMREKQAFYGLKMLQSKQDDIFNNPATTNNVQETQFLYQLISDNIMPYIFVLVPTSADLEAQGNLYHKYGNLNDQAEIVNLNDPWNRRCWNFWEIHNIEQAIVKDNLNHMAITFFNNLFNRGIRLWNVFNEEVVFNDYSLENWEAKLLENEK